MPLGGSPRFAILLVDSEVHTAELLAERFSAEGHRPHACAADAGTLAASLKREPFDALVIDYHLDRPGEIELGAVAKSVDASLPVIVLSAPGLALRNVEAWKAGREGVDHVIRKPIAWAALFRDLESLVARRRSDARAGRYAGLIAEEGLLWADSSQDRPALQEHAILFTDIRRSTQRIANMPLPEWFEALNRGLTAQGRAVRQCGGSVVKYTGDGLLASFRGRGRSHQALRCALELQKLDRSLRSEALRSGVGVAEGLVMTGLIGEPGRQQYDVLGATVHLAARLCSLAREGEIVTTPRLVRSSGITGSTQPISRPVMLRGFEDPIECVSFEPHAGPDFFPAGG